MTSNAEAAPAGAAGLSGDGGPAQGEPLLAVSGLQKYFPVTQGILLQHQVGAVKAVDGIEFSVDRGETLGLVGESGCGKSTAGRLLVRLLEPTGGSVHFEGEDITHTSAGKLRRLRREMQMIFQDPYSSLNPRHNIGTIVAAPMKLQKIRPEGGTKKHVQELLELVGLNPEHYNRYPHEFSGGQRQRIGIARALAVRPKIIICDEPVSALDVSIQAQVINLLEDIQNEFNLAYVFIAHDLSVVRHISDRVAVMYLGKIVEISDRVGPVRAPAAPVHPRVAVRGAGAGPGPGEQARAHPVAGRRAEPAQSTARLPLPHPVLEGAGNLQDCRTTAAGAPARPPGCLSLPRGAGARLMTAALSLLVIVTSIMLIVLILLHRGKGGGLSNLFGGGVSSSLGGSSVVEKNLDRLTIAIGLVWVAGIVGLGLLLK